MADFYSELSKILGESEIDTTNEVLLAQTERCFNELYLTTTCDEDWEAVKETNAPGSYNRKFSELSKRIEVALKNKDNFGALKIFLSSVLEIPKQILLVLFWLSLCKVGVR